MPMRPVDRRAARIALVCALGALAPGRGIRAQQERAPSGITVTAQVVTGTVVAPVAFVAGGLATKWVARHLGADEARERSLAYVGAWTLAGAATAAVPPLFARGGYYMASFAGTAIGGGAAAIMVASGRALFRDSARCGVVCTAWGIATFSLPAAGAAILYNRSR